MRKRNNKNSKLYTFKSIPYKSFLQVVYGISQFSNWGIFTTKPYISGSNNIRKVSNYKQEN